jgi:hypothetical protein
MSEGSFEDRHLKAHVKTHHCDEICLIWVDCFVKSEAFPKSEDIFTSLLEFCDLTVRVALVAFAILLQRRSDSSRSSAHPSHFSIVHCSFGPPPGVVNSGVAVYRDGGFPVEGQFERGRPPLVITFSDTFNGAADGPLMVLDLETLESLDCMCINGGEHKAEANAEKHRAI